MTEETIKMINYLLAVAQTHEPTEYEWEEWNMITIEKEASRMQGNHMIA